MSCQGLRTIGTQPETTTVSEAAQAAQHNVRRRSEDTLVPDDVARITGPDQLAALEEQISLAINLLQARDALYPSSAGKFLNVIETT